MQARIVALQQASGNRAVGQLLREPAGFFQKIKKAFGSSYIEQLGAEQVVVKSDAELKDAKRILKEIPEKYGVEVSSIKSMKALKTRRSAAPKAKLDALKTRPWLYKELKAVEKALQFYAPILGKQRASSTRKDIDQEIISVGKMEQKFGTAATGYEWKPNVMGEYFSEHELRAFTMYKHGETATVLFGDVEKEMLATATHEIAHGIFASSEGAWVTRFPYWLDADTASGAADVEAPPTSYGKTNAAEDLAESVMLYFVDPDRLKNGTGASKGTSGNPCPQRFAFIAELVGDWTPKPPVGDFPEPSKEVMIA